MYIRVCAIKEIGLCMQVMYLQIISHMQGSRRVINNQIVGYHMLISKNYGNEKWAVLAPKDERKSNPLSAPQFSKSKIL